MCKFSWHDTFVNSTITILTDTLTISWIHKKNTPGCFHILYDLKIKFKCWHFICTLYFDNYLPFKDDTQMIYLRYYCLRDYAQASLVPPLLLNGWPLLDSLRTVFSTGRRESRDGGCGSSISSNGYFSHNWICKDLVNMAMQNNNLDQQTVANDHVSAFIMVPE